VILAERTLYLPSLAVSLAIPAFVPAFRALTGTGQKFMLGVAAALVLAGAIRTWTRNPAWRSTDIVFETLARENPESYRGIWYTAATEMERGNVALALKLYGQAFELMPNEQQLGSTYAFELLSHGYAAGAERVVRQIFNSGYLFNHQVLIESLIRLGKYEEAEGELKIARGYFSRDSVLEKLEVLLLERRAAATDTVRGRGGGASLE
jgi:tetratricopeptide (TPR) repeat protein